MSSDPSSAPPAAWRAGAVRLAALWLLSGALLKLFAGSPQAMPELARSVERPSEPQANELIYLLCSFWT